MKFSDYRFIYLYISSESIVLDNYIIPFQLFHDDTINTSPKFRLIYPFLSPCAYVDIWYTSDTTVKIEMHNIPSSDTSQQYGVVIAGIN